MQRGYVKMARQAQSEHGWLRRVKRQDAAAAGAVPTLACKQRPPPRVREERTGYPGAEKVMLEAGVAGAEDSAASVHRRFIAW